MKTNQLEKCGMCFGLGHDTNGNKCDLCNGSGIKMRAVSAAPLPMRADEALSQVYYVVTGRSPAWSESFGYAQAADELKDWVRMLKESAKPS